MQLGQHYATVKHINYQWNEVELEDTQGRVICVSPIPTELGILKEGNMLFFRDDDIDHILLKRFDDSENELTPEEAFEEMKLQRELEGKPLE